MMDEWWELNVWVCQAWPLIEPSDSMNWKRITTYVKFEAKIRAICWCYFSSGQLVANPLLNCYWGVGG